MPRLPQQPPLFLRAFQWIETLKLLWQMLTKGVCAVSAPFPSRGQQRAVRFLGLLFRWLQLKGSGCNVQTRKEGNILILHSTPTPTSIRTSMKTCFLPSLVLESQEVDIFGPSQAVATETVHQTQKLLVHFSSSDDGFKSRISLFEKEEVWGQVWGKCLFYKHLVLMLLFDEIICCDILKLFPLSSHTLASDQRWFCHCRDIN